jgi:hypothetical protein
MPFSLDITKGYYQYQQTNSDTANMICQCDVKQMLQIKTIMSVLKILTYIITSITARPVKTLCNISDNVFLDLHNGHYSICL